MTAITNFKQSINYLLQPLDLTLSNKQQIVNKIALTIFACSCMPQVVESISEMAKVCFSIEYPDGTSMNMCRNNINVSDETYERFTNFTTCAFRKCYNLYQTYYLGFNDHAESYNLCYNCIEDCRIQNSLASEIPGK
ncbi:MAG: hypothetical protein ACRDDW_04780 [Candidatus Rhabdochlamydia sp.]